MKSLLNSKIDSVVTKSLLSGLIANHYSTTLVLKIRIITRIFDRKDNDYNNHSVNMRLTILNIFKKKI